MKANAFAWVGGPFSNGGFSTLIEQNGVYHATFSFKNGSGYAYFTPDNELTPPTQGLGGATSSSSSALSVQNRSVLYYRGMTFVGMAAGTSDIDKRKISGYTNGYSEYASSSTSSSSQGGATSTVTSSSVIVSNTGGNSYTANVHFNAKIKQTHPQIRFRGKGELAIISPNGFAQASELIAEFLESNFTDLTEQMSEAYQTVLDNIVTTSFPTSQILLVENTEIIPAVVDGEGNIIQPQGIATTFDPVTILADPYTQAQVQAGVDLMNLVSDSIVAQNLRLTDLATEGFYDALNPPSAGDIADQFTEYVPVRVTGVLRAF